jgi:hypothetical protein
VQPIAVHRDSRLRHGQDKDRLKWTIGRTDCVARQLSSRLTHFWRNGVIGKEADFLVRDRHSRNQDLECDIRGKTERIDGHQSGLSCP